MDTRAFRLPLPSDALVFELDEEPVLAEKQVVLDAQAAALVCRGVVVGADLADDRWPQSLTAAGFNSSARGMFIAEGLSWYLNETRVRASSITSLSWPYGEAAWHRHGQR